MRIISFCLPGYKKLKVGLTCLIKPFKYKNHNHLGCDLTILMNTFSKYQYITINVNIFSRIKYLMPKQVIPIEILHQKY